MKDNIKGCPSVLVIPVVYNGKYVKRIESNAFKGHREIIIIKLPSTITSIGENAFDECTSLVEIYNLSNLLITKSKESNGGIGYYAYGVHKELDEKSCLIEKGDFLCIESNEGLVLIKYLGRSNDVHIPDGIVEIKNNTFPFMPEITLHIPSTVKKICSEIGEGIITNTHTYSNGMSMSETSFPKFKIYYSGNAFELSEALNYDYHRVLEMYTLGEKKGEYKAVNELIIPEGVREIKLGYIGYNSICLDKIVIPSSIKSFSNYTQIKEIIIKEGVESITIRSNNLIKKLEIPSSVKSLNIDCCVNLSELIINKDSDLNYLAIERCSNLKEVFIPKSIESYFFGKCEGLEKVIIEEGAKEIPSYAFRNCLNLKEVTIPRGVKSIKSGAFSWCSRLSKVALNSGLEEIDQNAFLYCSSLEEIKLPIGVKSINNGAFCHCSSLKEIIIPDSVTFLGEYVFYPCLALERVTMPKKINSIHKRLFDGCVSLKEIKIWPGVVEIEEGAFSECKSLERIEIPGSVKKISLDAFKDCISLKYVKYPGKELAFKTMFGNLFANKKITFED